MPSVPEQPLPGKQVELPKVPTHEPTAEEAPKGESSQKAQQDQAYRVSLLLAKEKKKEAEAMLAS